ncbi:hypothetical protein ACS0TY_020122 [Phlomoides rotata]
MMRMKNNVGNELWPNKEFDWTWKDAAGRAGGLISIWNKQGRKFTWFKPDGTCKSKLDRILVNEEWLRWRPDLKLKSLGRSFSDHCPIFLKSVNVNWGPKPFKFFNGWLSHPAFKELCELKWNSYSVHSWKSFILKEKLKLLKADLKTWSRDIFGAMNQKMEDQKETIDKLDRFDEIFGLEEEEVIERNRVEAELKRNLIMHESFMYQKAKVKWIKEGDMNSGFYHSWINRRSKTNTIEGILIDESWVESKEGVRSAVFNHFQKLFKKENNRRIQFPGDLCKKKLVLTENNMLTSPFLEEEIKAAIWGCEANKSPGPDGFTFSFFKHFWGMVKT